MQAIYFYEAPTAPASTDFQADWAAREASKPRLTVKPEEQPARPQPGPWEQRSNPGAWSLARSLGEKVAQDATWNPAHPARNPVFPRPATVPVGR